MKTDLSKFTILVVDDFKSMRDVISGILQSLGAKKIQQAEDGIKAMKYIENDGMSFDLVVSDWNMPNMTGIELLKAIRRTDRYRKLPVILVTAEADKSQVMEAINAGVNNYIVKPFTQVELAERIDKVFVKKPK